jgi:hypothetical protein
VVAVVTAFYHCLWSHDYQDRHEGHLYDLLQGAVSEKGFRVFLAVIQVTVSQTLAVFDHCFPIWTVSRSVSWHDTAAMMTAMSEDVGTIELKLTIASMMKIRPGTIHQFPEKVQR